MQNQDNTMNEVETATAAGPGAGETGSSAGQSLEGRARLRQQLSQWRQGWVQAKIDAPLPGRLQRFVPDWASTPAGRVGIGLCAVGVLMLWLVPFVILAGL